jgi:hypothetical protein
VGERERERERRERESFMRKLLHIMEGLETERARGRARTLSLSLFLSRARASPHLKLSFYKGQHRHHPWTDC